MAPGRSRVLAAARRLTADQPAARGCGGELTAPGPSGVSRIPDDVTAIGYQRQLPGGTDTTNWPWRTQKLAWEKRVELQNAGWAVRNTLRELYGKAEGQRVFEQDFLPRYRALRQSVRPGYPEPGYWAAERSGAEEQPPSEGLALAARLRGLSAEEAAPLLATAAVWVPLDLESDPEGEGYPMMLQLPGDPDDPAADGMVPCFLEKEHAEGFLGGLGAEEVPMAKVPLSHLARDLLLSPGVIAVRLGYRAEGVPERWLTAADYRLIAAAAAGEPAPGASAAPAAQPAADAAADAAAAAGERELAALVDGMLSFLVCVRRSVRYAYLSAEEVGDDDVVVLGLQLAAEGDGGPQPQPAPQPTQRARRRRGLRRLTGERLARFRLRLADRLLKEQKPPVDITDPEPEQPVLLRVARGWRTMRRPRKRPPPDPLAVTVTEPVLGYRELLKRLKEHPPVAHLLATQLVIFKEIAPGSAIAASVPPFFDSTKEYSGVERAWPPEQEQVEALRQRRAGELALVKGALHSDLHCTLEHMRSRDNENTGTTVISAEDMQLLDTGSIARLVLGSAGDRDVAKAEDYVYAAARRRYALATRGPAAAARWGPPGTVMHVQGRFDPALSLPPKKRAESYLWQKDPATYRPGEGEMQKLELTPLEKRRRAEEFERRLVASGATDAKFALRESAEIAVQDPRLTKEQRWWGPWNNPATKDSWHSWNYRWRARQREIDAAVAAARAQR